jgi:hypothetical protein
MFVIFSPCMALIELDGNGFFVSLPFEKLYSYESLVCKCVEIQHFDRLGVIIMFLRIEVFKAFLFFNYSNSSSLIISGMLD